MKDIRFGKTEIFSMYPPYRNLGGWWFIDDRTGAEESGFRTKAEAVACARRIRKNFSS